MLLLLSLLVSAAAPAAYSAVVVDATTSRPLAAVSITNLDDPNAAPLTTDAAGRFSVAAAPVRLRLRLLGYAPLQVSRPAASVARPDTLRLLPQALALGEVAVRPGKTAVLASASDRGRGLARGLHPEQAVAVLVAPPDTTAARTYVIDKLRLFLFRRPEAGSLRIRLVQVQADPTSGSLLHPSTNDLLPAAVLVGLTELQAAPKGELTIDLSPYNLLLPTQGLYVTVECLPTNPDDHLVAINRVRSKNKDLVEMEVVLAPNPNDLTTTYIVDSDDFPVLRGQRMAEDHLSWLRMDFAKPWIRQSGPRQTNIRAEVSAYTY